MPVQAKCSLCCPAETSVGAVSVNCCLVASSVNGTVCPSIVAAVIFRSAALRTIARVAFSTAIVMSSSPEKVIAFASGRTVMS